MRPAAGHVDAVVVGAGPAGSVAAHGLARAGVSVLLVERQPFPRWKVCGACIGPAAIAGLRSAGLAAVVAGRGVPLTELALRAFGRQARVRLHGNVALSRSVFDAGLVDAAAQAGAVVRDGTRVIVRELGDDVAVLDLVRPSGSVETMTTSVVLDASGLAGGIGAVESAGWTVNPRARLGLGAVYDDAERDLPSGELQMIVGRAGYVGLVRVEDGTVNLGAAVDAAQLCRLGPEALIQAILDEAGEAPLRGGRIAGWKGTPPLTRTAHSAAARRLFRLGDASGYVEPFTGEGMGWAVESALAVTPFAVEAIQGWRDALAADWARADRRRAARARGLCTVLAGGLRRPGLVRSSVALLSSFPRLAAPLVRATGRAPVEVGSP